MRCKVLPGHLDVDAAIAAATAAGPDTLRDLRDAADQALAAASAPARPITAVLALPANVPTGKYSRPPRVGPNALTIVEKAPSSTDVARLVALVDVLEVLGGDELHASELEDTRLGGEATSTAVVPGTVAAPQRLAYDATAPDDTFATWFIPRANDEWYY
jgi:hypothetical protein